MTSSFRRPRPILAASIASFLAFGHAQAATYIYTGTAANSGTPTLWSGGTGAGWDVLPVSDPTTTLTFGNGASLPSARAHFTQNDFAGNFLLNKFNFTYAGPGTGSAPSVTISGNALEFVNDGVTTPVMTINATGSLRPNLTLNNDLVLTGNLTVAATSNATLGGALSGAGSLTKTGTGTITINGNANYQGGTTISAGVLRFGTSSTIPTTGNFTISSGGALGASGPSGFANAGDWITSGRIVNSSTGALAITANDSSAVDLATGGYSSLFLGATGSFTYSGTLTPGSAGYRLGGGGGTLTVSSALNAATTLTIGAGTVVLTNANSYTGTTTVSAGGSLNVQNNNALGSNATVTLSATAAAGASLQLQGGVTITGKALNASGTNSGQTGSLSNAISNQGGNNEWAGTITGNTANGNVRFGADGGNLLISGAVSIGGGAGFSLVLTGNNTGTISSTISTTGSPTTAVIKNGSSVWTLSGSNNYTGVTRIDDGVLLLMSANALPGGIGATGGTSNVTFNLNTSTTNVLGLGVGDFTRPLGTGASAVQWAATSNGGFAAYGANRVVNLGGAGAGVTWGAGSFVGNGQLLVLGAASADAMVDFQNAINFGTAVRTVQVNDGTAAFDAKLSGNLTSGAGGGLTKAGAGTLVLTGSNSYSGATTITGGLLLLSSAGALSASSNLIINGGVVGLATGDFTLPLGTTAGTVQWTGSGGFAAYGANRVVNLGGASAGVTWASGSFVPNTFSFVLGAASSDATVDFQNPIDLNGAVRTVQVDDGSALIDAKLSGAIGSATAGSALTKAGSGTLLLSGNNTYVGATTINAGILQLGHANALGTTDAGTTVAAGTLDLNGQTIGLETVSITGSGVNNAGALVNSSATAASLAGAVTLAAAASIGGSGDLTLVAGLNGNSTLTKVGAGTLTLNADAAARTTGSATIQEGTVVLKSNGALGINSTANSMQIGVQNATVEVNGSALTLDNGLTFTLNNGATFRTNGSNTVNSRLTVSTAAGTAVTATIATTNAADVFTLGNGSGDLTGGQGTDDVIRIVGPGAVRLAQTSTYVGNWSLEGGVTQLGAAAAFGSTAASTVTLSTGATLAGRLASSTVFTANPITVTGTGTATILADRSSVGAGVSYTFGVLSIGAQQLDVTHSAAVTSGTSTIQFGAPGASNVLTGNAIFNISGSQRVDLNLVGLDQSGGTYGFTKNGNGNLALTSTGTSYNYGGGVTLNAGGLFINRADALGTGTFTINGGTLDRTAGTGEVLTTNNAQAWNGSFSFAGTNTLNLGSGNVTLGNNVAVTTTASVLTVAGAIGDGGSGFGLTKAGAGTLILSGTSTYAGATTVSAGVLRVTSLANGGAASNLGQAANSAANLVLGGGRLEYVGAGSTTDRLFDLTASSTIASSGTGALVFSNTGATTASGTPSARTLTLTGYNRDENILAGGVVNSGTSSNTTGVTKSGSGTWVLAGTNTYTGATTVRGGSLILDYSGAGNTADPLSTGSLTLDGGDLTFRGKSTGTTTETIGALVVGPANGVHHNLVLDANGGSGINLTIGTLTGGSTTLQSMLIDVSSGTHTVTVTNTSSYATLQTNGVLMNSGSNARSTVIVRDASGYGFATLSGAAVGANSSNINRTLGKLVPTTPLTDSSVGGSTNFLYNTAGTVARTADVSFQTLTVDSTAGDMVLDFGAFNMTAGTNGRGILITGANDVSFIGTGGMASSQWFFNYGSGTFELNLGLGASGNLYLGGTGATNYGGTISSTYTAFHVVSGVTRLTKDQTLNPGAGGMWVGSGGVIEVGADLNGVTAGDFSLTVGASSGNIRFFGDSGLSAYTAVDGGMRAVNFGATLTWGSGSFLTNSDGTSDGDYTFKLSSDRSNATIEVQNGIALNGRSRVIEVANGSADVDARLTGAISGTAVGFTKTGAGTLALTGASTYTGATNVNAGALIVSGSLGGTTGGKVAAGATLNVTGTGSINAASSFEVSGVMNVVDPTSSAGAVKVNDDGVLGGNGTVGALVVANGGTISPGNSAGTLHAGSTIFQAGGTLKLELTTDGGTGTAGTDWDKLAIDATGTSTLDLTSLSAGTPFVLKLEAAALPGWDALVEHRWASIITTTGGFVGGTFPAGAFTFDTLGFSNTIDTNGFFRVEQNGNNVDLVYIPEPGPAVSLIGGVSMLLGLQRFRRRRA